jgi:gamma-glutamyltranspeptidase/glutathione hydrolase
VVTPGLGFMFNNSMANFDPRPGSPNSIAPGKSRSTGMAPTILSRGGRPVLVLGASGATKIITAIAQVILNVVDFGMTPQEAVNAPRFDCQGGPIRCHIRIPEAVCAVVRESYPIDRIPPAYGGLGLVHVVAIDPVDGRLLGGVDAGSSGMAIAEPPPKGGS